MDCSPPGSSIHGILQARILECIAISSPGDLPHPGIEPRSPALQVILYQLSYQESNENESSHLSHTSDVTSTVLGVLCE